MIQIENLSIFLLQLDNNQSQCVALFYLKVSQMKFLSAALLKKTCKEYNIVTDKISCKETLCNMLGDVLYKRKVMIRINNTEDISRSNLKCTKKDH